VREIQAAISTGKAHIDEMNDEPDAHIRMFHFPSFLSFNAQVYSGIEELERALRQCLGKHKGYSVSQHININHNSHDFVLHPTAPKSDTTSCTINQHDWFTLSLLRWCQWVRSVGFSTTQFLSTFEVMDAPIQCVQYFYHYFSAIYL
jgi:hypothetical protein